MHGLADGPRLISSKRSLRDRGSAEYFPPLFFPPSLLEASFPKPKPVTKMRLPLLFCFLFALVAVSAQLDDRTSLCNRALYTPRKRNSDDLPWVSPNISYINAFSRPHTTGLTDDVAWDRYSLLVSHSILRGKRLLNPRLCFPQLR